MLAAGVLVGLLALLADLSAGVTDALGGAALAFLALLGIPWAFGSEQPKRLQIMYPRKSAVRTKHGSDDITGVRLQRVEVIGHYWEEYRFSPKPSGVGADWAAGGGSSLAERVLKPSVVVGHNGVHGTQPTET
jgi:hypothetical protein